MSKELTGYELSRAWFDFCFENPEKISPNHTAIFFFAIEHCNRLGWKFKFGLPTQMAKDAIGISKHQTYIKYFNDLVEWGFLILVQKSTNQWSANIISLSNGITKNGNALDKAISKHGTKQSASTGQSNTQSNSPINKQLNNITYREPNKKLLVFTPPTLEEVKAYFLEKGYSAGSAEKAFNYYDSGNWIDSHGTKVKSWKQKMQGVWFKDENRLFRSSENQFKYVPEIPM